MKWLRLKQSAETLHQSSRKRETFKPIPAWNVWKRFYNFPSGCYCAFHLQKAAMMCQTMCIKKIDKYHNRSFKYNNHGLTCNRMRKDIFEKLLYMYAQLFMITKDPMVSLPMPMLYTYAKIIPHCGLNSLYLVLIKKINKHVY